MNQRPWVRFLPGASVFSHSLSPDILLIDPLKKLSLLHKFNSDWRDVESFCLIENLGTKNSPTLRGNADYSEEGKILSDKFLVIT